MLQKSGIFLLVALFFATTVSAWTAPTQAPPNGNVSAPVNVGTVDQVKNAGLSLNSLAVFGNAILSGASRYLNFGTTVGTIGYGVRDNAGTIEVKNNGGAWSPISTGGGGGISGGTTDYVAKYSSATALTESIITDNGTNVGISTTSPSKKFSVHGGGIGGTFALLPDYVNWNTYGTGSGGAGIYNDSGTYKKLMIVGNTSAGGTTRNVGIWDNLTVASNVYAVGYFHSSDKQLKNDIATSKGMDIIEKLRGVTFAWKKDGRPSAGVIAQEVEKVLPNAVQTTDDGIKVVEYDQLIAPLIEAVKEQQREIESLRHEIEILKSR